ncbi:MAG: preprotein translocase subunit SecY, preprotein translocase subunit SecY, partial [Candidatus Paceibacter sp.]|nr:preprotein translocase subunit SecY, preprotein translocase subunit SecY [Candidatus Paceibacter sp.]
IPLPDVDTAQLASFFAGNQLLGLLNIFTGGNLSQLSIMMLGVGPYITASIIMQLMTLLSPRLKSMYQEEGEYGRKKFAQFSRMLTVPLALIQGWTYLVLLQRQGVIVMTTPFDVVLNLALITAGSLFLMWLGERITEFGIGNGTSLIIFAGIVAALPTSTAQLLFTFDPSQIPVYLALIAGILIVTYAVVVITEAERPIPVTYAKRVRGNKVYGGVSTYLPLRLNQSGVIPIIFALSILLFPTVILHFLAIRFQGNESVVSVSNWVVNTFNPNGWVYALAYFVLVFAFTYFYTAVTFDPNQISENLQKNGAFIPGVRPGQSTAMHISKILTRLTAFGALFLGIIAILPLIVQAITKITAFTIGGTALLIVVSVVIDLIKKTEAQVTMKEY